MLKFTKAQLAHFISVPIVAAFTVGGAWLAKHFPGLPPLSNELVAAAGLAVGTFTAGAALHYLKGLREWERLVGEGEIVVDEEGDEAPLPKDAIPVPPTREQADAALAALPAGDVVPETDGGAPGGGE